ncbi:hypothetical protein Tco_1490933 [Tanacetum coccineum]
MESSSSNSEERELQQMQLEERELHQNCLEWFTKLKTHLEFLPNKRLLVGSIVRLYQTAFRIFFQEEYETFSVMILHNLNQLQWKLERKILHSSNPKSCLKVLRTQLKEFFDSKEQQESLITESAAIEACLVTKGATLEACLVNEGIALNDNTGVMESSGTESANSSSSETRFRSSADENKSSNKESSSSEGNDADADIGSSNDSNTLLGVYHDLFINMFAHGIQNHKHPKFIPDTYVVNKNNSNIISHIPNMDSDRNKEEHDYVEYEQQRAFFASLINNLKCDVEKCNEVNREAQKIKLLNDEISNLKSQACEKDKTFAKENEKYDEYVQALLERKNKLEKKNQEFLKQINVLDNRLQKAGQIGHIL